MLPLISDSHAGRRHHGGHDVFRERNPFAGPVPASRTSRIPPQARRSLRPARGDPRAAPDARRELPNGRALRWSDARRKHRWTPRWRAVRIARRQPKHGVRCSVVVNVTELPIGQRAGEKAFGAARAFDCLRQGQMLHCIEQQPHTAMAGVFNKFDQFGRVNHHHILCRSNFFHDNEIRAAGRFSSFPETG